MIIANRLKDGVVVFLAAGERWVPKIGDGRVIEDVAEQQSLLAAAKADEAKCLVVDPVLIDVVVEPTGPKPVAIREAIRAFGPTI